MEHVAGPPSKWIVTLAAGGRVEVWADSVDGLSGEDDTRDYTFGNLIDVDPDHQAGLAVIGTTPTNPRRVIVTVARFPRPLVADVESG